MSEIFKQQMNCAGVRRRISVIFLYHLSLFAVNITDDLLFLGVMETLCFHLQSIFKLLNKELFPGLQAFRQLRVICFVFFKA